jgi:hypothetical protein
MGIGIKIKNSKPQSEVRDKCERDWHQGGGLGFRPGTTKKFEGMGEGYADKIRYAKGYQRMKGICAKCEFYKGKAAKQGKHCKKKECVK